MIYIDANEPKDIQEMLRNIGLDFKVKKLYVGDYVVEGKNGVIAVERKAISDYISSLVDGRLQNQLYNLSTYYEYSFLVIVGYVSYALMYSKFRRDAYIASLISASLKKSPTGKSGQVIVVNVETDYDFALFLKMLQKFLNEQELYRLPRLVVNKEDKELMYASMLTAIPGIGEEKAKAIIRKFKTIQNVANATIEQLMNVEGIGRKTAERIYKFMRGDVSGN